MAEFIYPNKSAQKNQFLILEYQDTPIDGVMEIRTSKSTIQDFQKTPNDIQIPPFDYTVQLELVDNDPVLGTAVDLTVDATTYNGYTFSGGSDEEITACLKYFEDELDFDQVIENILYQYNICGDAYLELVMDNDNIIRELYALPTEEIRVSTNLNGKVNKYVQLPKNMSAVRSSTTTKQIEWLPDSIIHFKYKSIGNKPYSSSPFRSIMRDYNSSILANFYLQSIFKNLPPKYVFSLKNNSKEMRELLIENLRRAKTNPNVDIIGFGKEEFDAKVLQVNFDSGLVALPNYFQSRLAMLTRVPKLWLGISDGANRSTSEAEIIPFETKIKKDQARIASQLNRELMSKTPYPNLRFQWNPISLMDEKAIAGIVQQMIQVGFDNETIIQYAREKGFPLRQDVTIEKPQMQQLQKDGAPSRQRENQKTDTMSSNLDQKGMSADGGAKLEQHKQAVKR
ncbi:phage portal protein [Candidatus Woesearchaeota archaeon]|nr:phage portal protein [Candidatus Woesearchaeota archaeon]MBI4451945.1 phage portal protein [Candidatus Woesearchaeota archaeon]